MSFTEDELQAFNTILEQRFAAHRQEMEQVLERRLMLLQREADRRFAAWQEEVRRALAQMGESPETGLAETLHEQQAQIAYTLSQEAEQKARQVEATIDRMLAAQLLGIEQLLSRQQENSFFAQHFPQQLEEIEVQTELSWEDLAGVLGQTLDERLLSLNNSLQRSVKELEQSLIVRLHSLRDEITNSQDHARPYNGQMGNGTSVQEMLAGIEHLDRVMESMQVAMTANHALLSNRLYHHQQLPLERAHPMSRSQVTAVGENTSLLAQAKERLASNPNDETASQPDEGEEVMGQ
ncbi:MAG TPA: hypothetical protein VFV38_17720 [Ktedonobacteraceae bacterium]|nr:hypothetical protein [Ktedonobacteraceae bacterium]